MVHRACPVSWFREPFAWLEPNSGSASPGIQDVLIRGVRLVNNEGSGIHAAGGMGTIVRITVEDSTFVNNGTNDYAGEGRAAGVRIGLSHSLVQNNMFTLHGTNVFRGIIDIPASLASEGNVIRGNTFMDNTNPESVVYVHGSSGPNNFIVDNVFLRNAGRSISNQNARSPTNPTGTCAAGNATNGVLDVTPGSCGALPPAGYAP